MKDFSEWSPAERAELLDEMLVSGGRRFFLISNTGTLLNTFKAHEQVGDGVCVENDLLEAMSKSEPSEIAFHETSFSVLNIAMIDNLGIAR